MASPGMGFLPHNLKLMLGYIYKCSVRQNLSGSIVSDKVTSTATIPCHEVQSQVDDDLQKFVSMLSLHSEENKDFEQRQCYQVSQ